MKFFRFFLFSMLLFSLAACQKDNRDIWNVQIQQKLPVEIIDISKDFYDINVPLNVFQQKYPWFQSSIPDAEFAARRTEADEVKIYKDAISKIDLPKLQNSLSDLFSHIKYYFPKFDSPKVFLYSSALQGIDDPIFYKPQENFLFIDISAFLGTGSQYYKGYDQYLQASMNPQNIVPKVSEILAENLVPPSRDHQKFIDQIIYQGKIMTLQDAFLPGTPDALKINYTQKQYEWAKANEANIWNYFVENNLVFSDDPQLQERFIQQGPFSKFYTEIDNQSSPQIGIFTGWQICRSFFNQKPETKLEDFLKMNATEIFNQSNYNPKTN